MARVVLHIGTHKTASTTLQDTFAHNADLLARHGVIYPRLGRGTGHHGLVKDWNTALPPVYALPDGSVGTLQQLAQTHAAGDGTLILSSEEFSRGQSDLRPDLDAIRATLSSFDQIEVVCVLREQWQFVQSIYLEVSKSRQPQRLPQLLETVLHQNMIEGLWTDYTLLYDHLLQSFAPAEITFLDFDRCRSHKDGIVGVFLQHLGVPLTAGDLELVNEGRSNISPGALPTWAANVVAEPGVAPKWLIEAMTGAFDVQFGPKVSSRLWTRDECRMLMSYAARCNARLCGRLAPYQPGFSVTRTALDAGSPVFREDLPSDYWMRANRWTYAGARRAGVAAT